MKLKSVTLLSVAAAFALALTGCAQDSTNTTDENPAMQEQLLKGETASAATGAAKGSQSTNPTRTEAKGGTAGTKVALSADPNGALKYNTDKLNANAGALKVAFTNESPVPHDVAIAQGGKIIGKTKEITKSNATLVIKEIKPGSYSFYCTVPGHKQAGMVGTLTVK